MEIVKLKVFERNEVPLEVKIDIVIYVQTSSCEKKSFIQYLSLHEEVERNYLQKKQRNLIAIDETVKANRKKYYVFSAL